LYEKRLRNYLSSNQNTTNQSKVDEKISEDTKKSEKTSSFVSIPEPVKQTKLVQPKQVEQPTRHAPEPVKKTPVEMPIRQEPEPVKKIQVEPAKPIEQIIIPSIRHEEPFKPVQPVLTSRNYETSSSVPSKPAHSVVTERVIEPSFSRTSTQISSLFDKKINIEKRTSLFEPTPIAKPAQPSLFTRNYESTLPPEKPVSPIKDKFAERLNNYGLLKDSSLIEPKSTYLASSSTISASCSTVRSRPSIHQEKQINTNLRKEAEQEPKSTHVETNVKKEEAKKAGFDFNWKYFLAVIIATALVYLFIIQLQGNPENPVEL